MHRQEAYRQKLLQSDSGLKKMGPVLGPLHHFGLEGCDWPIDMGDRLLSKVLEFEERWRSWSQLNRSHPGLEHKSLWTSRQLWLLLFWALESRAESEEVSVGSEAVYFMQQMLQQNPPTYLKQHALPVKETVALPPEGSVFRGGPARRPFHCGMLYQ